MDERNFWVKLWLSVMILFVVLVLGLMGIYNYKVIRMAELGFQETTVQGSACTVFQKVEKK